MPIELDAGLVAILDELVDEYVTDQISAASLSGSFARGDADAFSDIDLRLYTDLPLEGVEGEHLTYRNGRLVSISYHTFRGEARQFADPSSAVFAVHPIRTLMPLRDRAGSLAQLQRQAHAFRWEAIAGEADMYAARVVYQQAEVVHKTLGSLTGALPLRATISTMELVQELTLAIAVARHVLVASDRTYLQQVYEAVSETSAWAEAHRLAVGVTAGSPTDEPYVTRGVAALRLYGETAQILDSILAEEQRAVILHARELIRKHGHVRQRAYAP